MTTTYEMIRGIPAKGFDWTGFTAALRAKVVAVNAAMPHTLQEWDAAKGMRAVRNAAMEMACFYVERCPSGSTGLRRATRARRGIVLRAVIMTSGRTPKRNAPRRRKSLNASALTEAEIRDIKLWFGWGSIYGYPTGPRAYLREVLSAKRRAEFLAIPRTKRKAILRFVIDEHARRSAAAVANA